jgi:spermidine/putrescine transport system permease protein
MTSPSETRTLAKPPVRPVPVPEPTRRRRGWRTDPWRKPRILEAITWAYLLWSLVPVLIAVFMSFSSGRSNSTFQGPLTFQWWWGTGFQTEGGALFSDPDLRSAIRQTFLLSFATMLIAVPLGVAFAIGLDRWRGRAANATNFMMMMSFVLPELVLGVAALYVVLFLLTFIDLGTQAQIMALVTFQLSYPVIIVRARLLSIGKEYEEAAMDLGATPQQSVRAVLLPLLAPAIFASCAIVFADTIDDFVTVTYLSSDITTQPLSTKIYTNVRGSPTPAVNAAATFMLVTTTFVIALGYIAYRRFSRGQRGAGMPEIGDFRATGVGSGQLS